MLFAPFLFLSFDGNRTIRFWRTRQGNSKKYREIFCVFIVLTIFFTLAVARFVFAHIKVVRPKSDRLSARKKKTSCFFLVHKTTSQSRKFFASSTEIFQKNEKNYSKSQESCEFDRYPLGKKEKRL